MSEKFKKALRIAVNVGCGFEGDAEDAAELLTLITGLESRIAELAQAVGLITTLKPTMVMDTEHPLDMAKEVAEYVNARIAELERDKKALRGIEENLREHIDIGTLQLSVESARIAELKAYIDQLIEIGSWAITGMTITTSYSPGVLQDLAEKKIDDWCALIKNLEECDKENEREE